MVKYEKGFDHLNTTDIEETVVILTSTVEEPKHLNKIVFNTPQIQDAYIYGHLEREKVIDKTPHLLLGIQEISIEHVIDMAIPVGQSFTLSVLNKVAGSNGNAIGYLEYEIKV